MTAHLQKVFVEFEARLRPFGQVVLAGGAVRDSLMGREPKDYDLFVLQGAGFDFEKAKTDIAPVLSDLTPVPPEIEWHNSEPYLITTVEWGGVQVQVLVNPAATISELVGTFDWNVCLFAFDGREYFKGEEVENIGVGQDLRLQKVTFALSTLRRGFRFSERFKMRFQYADVLSLCKEIVANDASGNRVGPSGSEPDASALAANVLVDDDTLEF